MWWFSRNWHKCEHTIHFFIFSQKTLNSWNSSIPVLSTWFIVKGNMWTDMVKTKNRAAVTCMCTRMCDSQDTSIRLMILWQVLRVRPSNFISFPEDKTRLSRRETSKMICWFKFLSFWQMIHEKCHPDVVYSGGADLRLLRTPFSICWSSLTEIAWSCKHGEKYIYGLNHKILLLSQEKPLSDY